MEEQRFLKKGLKKLALYTCSIHNIFLGIYKVWLQIRDVDIVAKGASKIILLEKNWLYRTTLWKTKELWQEKNHTSPVESQQNLLKS